MAQSFLDGLDATRHEDEPESEESPAAQREAAAIQQIQMPNALMRAFDAASSDTTGSMGQR